MDSAGNVRIDRPAAKGLEHAPSIILQGHLDMVPKSAPGKTFDFQNEPLKLILENGSVRADGTTLGADNGAGCAAALALLFDPELQTGPLAGLFTVGEEVGLIGANALEPDMLEGDWLFNLDSGDYDNFCIGCAGGARLSFHFLYSCCSVPEGKTFKLSLTGLSGGHSGITIHENRGNALILLAQFLKTLPGAALASFDGGTADNAIPSEAEAVIVLKMTKKELQQRCREFVRKSSETFHAPAAYKITAEFTDQPDFVMDDIFTEQFLTRTATVPNGALDFDKNQMIDAKD
jgi:dipeptidase D